MHAALIEMLATPFRHLRKSWSVAQAVVLPGRWGMLFLWALLAAFFVQIGMVGLHLHEFNRAYDPSWKPTVRLEVGDGLPETDLSRTAFGSTTFEATTDSDADVVVKLTVGDDGRIYGDMNLPFINQSPLAARSVQDLMAALLEESRIVHSQLGGMNAVIQGWKLLRMDASEADGLPSWLWRQSMLIVDGHSDPVAAEEPDAPSLGYDLFNELMVWFSMTRLGWCAALMAAGIAVVFADARIKGHLEALISTKAKPHQVVTGTFIGLSALFVLSSAAMAGFICLMLLKLNAAPSSLPSQIFSMAVTPSAAILLCVWALSAGIVLVSSLQRTSGRAHVSALIMGAIVSILLSAPLTAPFLAREAGWIGDMIPLLARDGWLLPALVAMSEVTDWLPVYGVLQAASDLEMQPLALSVSVGSTAFMGSLLHALASKRLLRTSMSTYH